MFKGSSISAETSVMVSRKKNHALGTTPSHILVCFEQLISPLSLSFSLVKVEIIYSPAVLGMS